MITEDMQHSEVLIEIERMYSAHGNLTSQDVGQLIERYKQITIALYEAEAIIDARYNHGDAS